MSNGRLSPHNTYPLKLLDKPLAPLKTPTLLNNAGNRTPLSAASTASAGGGGGGSGGVTAFEWPKVTNKTKKI